VVSRRSCSWGSLRPCAPQTHRHKSGAQLAASHRAPSPLPAVCAVPTAWVPQTRLAMDMVAAPMGAAAIRRRPPMRRQRSCRISALAVQNSTMRCGQGRRAGCTATCCRNSSVSTAPNAETKSLWPTNVCATNSQTRGVLRSKPGKRKRVDGMSEGEKADLQRSEEAFQTRCRR
jgi:hypothetical protein